MKNFRLIVIYGFSECVEIGWFKDEKSARKRYNEIEVINNTSGFQVQLFDHTSDISKLIALRIVKPTKTRVHENSNS